jgi:hypothetical protein
MTVNGKRYVVGGFPGPDWVQNVKAASEVTPSRGRRRERVPMPDRSPEALLRVGRDLPDDSPRPVRTEITSVE